MANGEETIANIVYYYRFRFSALTATLVSLSFALQP